MADSRQHDIPIWDNARRMAGEKPVISVKNVSMYFQIATQNVSGIKEFAIQKIKGRMRYRELRALDHVSFDVYKGEVVGIIGTNGSGKSTLLKIVSGSLKAYFGKSGCGQEQGSASNAGNRL